MNISPFHFKILSLAFFLWLIGNPVTAQESLLEKKIYLEEQSGKISDVLSKIEIAGGFTFTYGNVPADKIVHLEGGTKRVGEFLDEILVGIPVIPYARSNKNNIAFIPGPGYQNIRGRITDRESGSPLLGAHIIIYEAGPIPGVISEQNGYFKIPDIPVGRHTILVSYVGYEPHRLYEVLVSSGKEKVLDVELVERFENIEEIIVPSNKRKSEPNNYMATVSARSFTVEETKRYPAAVNDPARMALVFPGVTTGDEDIFNELVVRSHSEARVLWRMEGIDIPAPNHFSAERSTTGWISMLSANLLGRSDFITGAFPAEYGNTISGVFDISLRNGNNENDEYSFQFGALGTDLSIEGPFSENYNGSYLLNFRYSTLNPMLKMGIIELDKFEEVRYWDLSYKVHLPTKNAGNFSLWGIGGSGRAIDNADDEDYEVYEDIAKSNLVVLGLTHLYLPNEKSSLKSVIAMSLDQAIHNLDTLNNVNRQWNTISLNDYGLNSLKASMTYRYKFNSRLFLKLGSTLSHLLFDYEQYDSDARGVGSNGNTNLIQGFAQGKFSLSPDLNLMAGFHYLYFALNGKSSLEPRLGLKWDFANDQSFGLGIGKHSQTEYLSTYFQMVAQPDGSYSVPNRELDLAKSIHYILAYDNTLIKNFHFKSELYYQHLYDIPVKKSSPYIKAPINNEHPMDTLLNLGRGRNYGIEFTLDKYFSRGYYFLMSSSFYDSKIDPGNDTLYNTRGNAGYAQNMVGGKEFQIGKKKQNLIGLNAKIIWTGGNRGQSYDSNYYKVVNDRFEERYEDYFRLDVNFTYRINRPRSSHSFSVDIQNVTNRMNIVRIWYDIPAPPPKVDEQTGIVPFFSYKVEF